MSVCERRGKRKRKESMVGGMWKKEESNDTMANERTRDATCTYMM